MAVLETIPGIEDYIRKRIIEDRATHQVVSEELKLLHPWISRGLSSRSIRQFCETRFSCNVTVGRQPVGYGGED